MPRMEPVDPKRTPLLTRIALRFGRRLVAQKLGRDPGEATMPSLVMAHHAKVLQGYGALEYMLARSRSVPADLRNLARHAVSPLVGCPW